MLRTFSHCWNKLREEITADALYKGYQIQSIVPVNNVIKVNHYREQEREKEQQSSRNFSELLEREKNKTRRKAPEKKAPLRLMGGLNQYNRKAMEVCFYLSSETDYTV